jgi:hypothetical protein
MEKVHDIFAGPGHGPTPRSQSRILPVAYGLTNIRLYAAHEKPHELSSE